MIRPRPTQHIAAEPFGLYTMGTVVHRHQREPAWCPHCNAKLSTYRPLGDVSCWACQQGTPIDPEALHPPVLVASQRQRKKPTP